MRSPAKKPRIPAKKLRKYQSKDDNVVDNVVESGREGHCLISKTVKLEILMLGIEKSGLEGAASATLPNKLFIGDMIVVSSIM